METRKKHNAMSAKLWDSCHYKLIVTKIIMGKDNKGKKWRKGKQEKISSLGGSQRD